MNALNVRPTLCRFCSSSNGVAIVQAFQDDSKQFLSSGMLASPAFFVFFVFGQVESLLHHQSVESVAIQHKRMPENSVFGHFQHHRLKTCSFNTWKPGTWAMAPLGGCPFMTSKRQEHGLAQWSNGCFKKDQSPVSLWWATWSTNFEKLQVPIYPQLNVSELQQQNPCVKRKSWSVRKSFPRSWTKYVKISYIISYASGRFSIIYDTQTVLLFCPLIPQISFWGAMSCSHFKVFDWLWDPAPPAIVAGTQTESTGPGYSSSEQPGVLWVITSCNDRKTVGL